MVVESRNHRFLPPLLGKAGNTTPPPPWLFLRVLRSGAVPYSFLPPQLKRVSSPYLNNRKYLPRRKENLVISFTSTLCCAFFLAACTAYLEGVSTALAELLRNYSYSKDLSESICVAATARAHSSPKRQRLDVPMRRGSGQQIAHQSRRATARPSGQRSVRESGERTS